MIGNKLDLANENSELRQVTTDEAKQFAEENKIYSFETSAKSGFKVVEAFESLVECKLPIKAYIRCIKAAITMRLLLR